MSNIETGGPAFPLHPDMAAILGCINSQSDCGMTLRQYAAIKLRVPNSGTDWLDDMIRESLRDEFAAKAMQGFITNLDAGEERPLDVLQLAKSAYNIADAMLKARDAC